MKLQKRRTKSIRTINIITKHHENCEPKDKCVTDILTNTLQLQDRCHGCFNVWRVIVTNVYTQKIERLLSIFTVIKRDLSAKRTLNTPNQQNSMRHCAGCCRVDNLLTSICVIYNKRVWTLSQRLITGCCRKVTPVIGTNFALDVAADTRVCRR